MDLWIIIDGEKSGPIHDFEVRRRILSGEFTAETPAWHEGMDTWKPLGEINLFQGEFREPPAAKPEPATTTLRPPPLPQQPAYSRRFWARWFDLTLYGGIWWICMWAARQNVEAALLNPWIMFFQFVPWFLLEALLIHYTGTTLGKWLLGLRVTNLDGSRLSLAASTRRALQVMFTGVGFGWGLLALFCQALSYFTAKRLGTTLWDHTGGHRVLAGSHHPIRIITLVFLFFAAIQLQAVVLYPTYVKLLTEQSPNLKPIFDNNPQWSLPTRR